MVTRATKFQQNKGSIEMALTTNWDRVKQSGIKKGEKSEKWKRIKAKRRRYLKSQKKLKSKNNIIKQKEFKLIEDLVLNGTN
jgi:hypothetical protein